MQARISKPELLASTNISHCQHRFARGLCYRPDLHKVDVVYQASFMKSCPDPVAFSFGVNPVENRVELGVVNRSGISASQYDLDEMPELMRHGVG